MATKIFSPRFLRLAINKLTPDKLVFINSAHIKSIEVNTDKACITMTKGEWWTIRNNENMADAYKKVIEFSEECSKPSTSFILKP